MPYVALHTNYPVSDQRKPKLLKYLSKLIQDELGKPESTVMISILQPEAMIFAGDERMAAFVEVKGINLDPNHNTKLCGVICNAIEQEIGIPSDRIYINFSNIPGNMWGWNKQIFQK